MSKKEQVYLNEAIYDKGTGSLDDIEKEKPVKIKKKPLGYDESFIDSLFKKRKVVKNQPTIKKKKETTLSKPSSNPLNILKKKKKGMTFFNNL